MEFFRLAYLSKIKSEFTETELLEFSIKSRKNNSEQEITSVLFYGLGVFIQVIEGENTKVKALYNTIKDDERHEKVILLFEQYVAERHFSHWSLKLLAVEDTRFDRILEFNQFLHNYKKYNKVNLNSSFIQQIKQFHADKF